MIERARLLYDRFIGETVWFRASGVFGAFFGGLFLVYSQLPDNIKYTPPKELLPVIFLVAVILYLLFVTTLFDAQVRHERQLRRLESAFRYDKRGTLYNGSQPNIAFRIATFKRIFEGMSTKLGKSVVQETLLVVGKNAAVDFASSLPKIYESDVARPTGGRPWDDLSFDQKLYHWAEYDSSTGWGVVTAQSTAGGALVTIVHMNGLFADEGGLQFGYFLAGYCETVLTYILEDHKKGVAPGKFADFLRGEFVELKTRGKHGADGVELIFKWV